MRLSIAMIVKNEEKKIERCLKSIRRLDDKIDYEIVITDTGSNDNTVNMAKKYTNKIFFEKWNNSFADMRNISISHCKGEWILVIDADEVLENPDDLVSILNSEDIDNYNSIKVSQRNAEKINSENYSIVSVFRFLKNNKDFKFFGSIHEQPNIVLPEKESNIILFHDGYIYDNITEKYNKTKRNRELLISVLNKSDVEFPVYYLHQLAKNYYANNEIMMAFRTIKKAYEIEDIKYRYTYGYVNVLYGKILLALGNYDESIKVINEIVDIYNDNLDYYYILGKNYYFKKDYENALIYYSGFINLYNKRNGCANLTTKLGEDYLNKINDILMDYVKCIFKLENYFEVISTYNDIDNNLVKDKLRYYYYYSLIMLKRYDTLKKEIHNTNNECFEDITSVLRKLEINLCDMDEIISNIYGTNEILDEFLRSYFNVEDVIYADLEDIDLNEFSMWKVSILKKNISNYDDLLVLKDIKDADKYIIELSKEINYLKILYEFSLRYFYVKDFKVLRLLHLIEMRLLANYSIIGDDYNNLVMRALINNYNLYGYYMKKSMDEDYIIRNCDAYELMWIYIYKLIFRKNNKKEKYIRKLRGIIPELEEYMHVIEFFTTKLVSSDIYEKISKEKKEILEKVSELINAQEYAEAMSILNNVLELLPFDGELLGTKGVLQCMINDLNGSLVNIAFDYEFRGQNFEPSYNLGTVLERLGRKEESVSCYKIALEYCTDYEMMNYIRNKI